MADRFQILLKAALPGTWRAAATDLRMSHGSFSSLMNGTRRKGGIRVETLMKIMRYVKATPIEVLEFLDAHEERFKRPSVFPKEGVPWKEASSHKAAAKRDCAPAVAEPSLS